MGNTNNNFYRLFPLFLISISLYEKAAFGYTNLEVSDSKVRCIERERQALLKFKQGLLDDFDILSSWGSGEDKKECCKWWGVKCSNKTGHVIILDLHQAELTGVIPHELGNLTSLQTLDLGLSFGLTTSNLEWLSQLRFLRQLDLSTVYLNDTNWPQVIFNLPFLENLFLRSCNLELAKPSSLLISNSSSESLSVLDLSLNSLTSSSTYYWLFNISKNLVSIYLSDNFLEGLIPSAFGEMIYLKDINLAANHLEGGVPKSFKNLSHLCWLSLANNDNLSEPFSEFLQKLSRGVDKSLESLLLSGNQFSGPLADLTRFSSLRELDLRYNRLNGSLLDNCALPPNLLYLDFSFNQISGDLLLRSSFESLDHPPRLEYLDLSNNQISRLVSDLNVFPSLSQLYLNSNKLRGNVPESIGQLSELKGLDLSFNSLAANMSSDWFPTFQLGAIMLANCNVGPHFPQWLRTQKNFSKLDLSFGGISDILPDWFWDLSPKLEYLNLSYNQINGKLPELSEKFHGDPTIDLNSNNFSGPILSIPPHLTLLHLYKNMFVGSASFLCGIMGDMFRSLDLSDNLFSGNLPNCWMNMQGLVVLNLGNNNFSGPIPKSLGFLDKLQTLHLRNNSLVGEFPASLKNCTELMVIDVGGNQLTGNIPAWIGTHQTSLVILCLRSNKFSGSVPQDICHLSYLQILDLSHNNIIGEIPNCLYNFTFLVQKNSSSTSISFGFETFDRIWEYTVNVWVIWKRQELEYGKTLGYLKTIDLSSNKLVGQIPKEIASLTGLISLNLSTNHLTGNIIEHIGQMEMLESLDLSRNQLSGAIPTGLAHLHYLSVLDLSCNRLSGKIPSSTQLQSFDASAYMGNYDLCGLPLEKCPWDSLEPQPSDHEEVNNVPNEDELETMEFYMCLGFGFLFGLLGVFVILLKASWRNAYFRFLQNTIDWLDGTLSVYMARLMRKLNG